MPGFLALALMVLTTSAFADGWRVQTISKETKGAGYVAATTYDVNHPDHAGALKLIKTNDGKYLIAVESGGKPITCSSVTCKLVVKFGNGKYAEYLAHLSREGDAILPYDAKRFAVAMSKVDEIKVDLHFPVESARQLIFQVKDMPVVIARDAKASFMKYSLGERLGNIAGLPTKSDKTVDGSECFLDLDAALFVSIPIQAGARSCFFNGEMASLVLTVPRSRKSDIAALERSLNALYGKPDGSKSSKRWPSVALNNGGREWHTTASSWDMGNEVWYMVGDNSLSDLAPKAR